MESYKEVGRSVKRVDAYDKVTGRAMFTDDLCPKPCLVAKILHSTIGNGRVVSIDTDEAKKVPGVVGVFTCFDVPDFAYPVAGHPWYADSAAAKRDIADRGCWTTACAFTETTSQPSWPRTTLLPSARCA